MKVVYNNKTNNILSIMSDNQKPRDYKNIPLEDVSVLLADWSPNDSIQYYKIEDGRVVRRSQIEIEEVRKYGKILLPEERIKLMKSDTVELSKKKLAEHLQNNPLLFLDGKHYSVTSEKQNLLNNAISVYQIKIQAGIHNPELEWNATGEECVPWTIESLSSLALAISEYVTPLVKHQQAIEVQTKNCTTREELESIVIDYETV